MIPAHQKDTKTFSELTYAEQAWSINASINNLEASVDHHVSHSTKPSETSKKCIEQIDRFLARLRAKYPTTA